MSKGTLSDVRLIYATNKNIWTVKKENVPSDMSTQDANKPVLPRSPIRVFFVRIKKLCIIGYQHCAQPSFRSTCAAQADLNLRFAHMFAGTFSDVAAHMCYQQNMSVYWIIVKSSFLTLKVTPIFDNGLVQVQRLNGTLQQFRSERVRPHSLNVSVRAKRKGSIQPGQSCSLKQFLSLVDSVVPMHPPVIREASWLFSIF